MSRIYGAAWVSSFGESDDSTWLRGLCDLTPEDLAYGLEACANQKPDDEGNVFPPNLPKFRSICKPKSYPYLSGTYVLPECEPGPELTKEEKLKWIAACRKALSN